MKPKQLEVPGFGVFLADCKRYHREVKGLQSGKRLPLFDGVDFQSSVTSGGTNEGQDLSDAGRGPVKFTGESTKGWRGSGVTEPNRQGAEGGVGDKS